MAKSASPPGGGVRPPGLSNSQVWPLPTLSTMLQPSCGVVPVQPVNASLVPRYL